jgi:hypothetical protein
VNIADPAGKTALFVVYYGEGRSLTVRHLKKIK